MKNPIYAITLFPDQLKSAKDCQLDKLLAAPVRKSEHLGAFLLTFKFWEHEDKRQFLLNHLIAPHEIPHGTGVSIKNIRQITMLNSSIYLFDNEEERTMWFMSNS